MSQQHYLEGKYDARFIRSLNNYQLFRIQKGTKDVALFIPKLNFNFHQSDNTVWKIPVIIRPWREADAFDPRSRIKRLEEELAQLKMQLGEE